MALHRHAWLAALLVVGAVAPAAAETHAWSQPDIDHWLYPASITPGERTLGPTFSFLDGEGTELDPARRGTTLVGFNTTIAFDAGLVPGRYRVDSARLTLTLAPGNGLPEYDPTFDRVEDILNGVDDPGRPIELYGLGFQNGYERLGFGALDYEGPEFEEGTPQWSFGVDTYNVFPVGDDGQGQLTDVYNNLSGGYNAVTANYEPAWDTIPWAIGQVPGLSAGALVSFDTAFEFDVDLELPGVLDYVQRSLADGALGFLYSSLHQPDGHTGSTVYPQWYLKEYPLPGLAPTLELKVTILAEGDANGDGLVTGADYTIWADNFGAGPNATFAQGDFNGDGHVTGADYTLWADNFGASSGAQAVPEPTTATLAALAGAGLLAALARRRGRS